MSKSKIKWTDLTINPIVGCSKCSPGCENCYAETMAKRLAAMGMPQYCKVIDIEDMDGGNEFECSGEKLLFHGWNSKTAFVPSAFDAIPKRGNKKIFIGSMTDIFHESVPFEWIDKIMLMIAKYRQHTFQILTKRPERMKEYFRARPLFCGDADYKYFKNLWLGVTVCNQEEADRNIPLLLKTPAAVRFVSIEPMLGEIDLSEYLPALDENGYRVNALSNKNYLDWSICGGESGAKARPLNPDWVISLRDQCHAANVPFFFKQWGKYEYDKISKSGYIFDPKLGCNRPIDQRDMIIGDYVYRKPRGKKSGNRLYGQIYEQFPKVK